VILQELLAHSHYSQRHYPVAYWRTASHLEVDFIVGDHEIAVEVKGVEQAAGHHTKGLRAFRDEYTTRHTILVSLDAKPRRAGPLWILPWEVFLQKLWADELFKP
jgi:predicted AAA+ superfamily ATPase